MKYIIAAVAVASLASALPQAATTFDCASASFPGESGCGSAPTSTTTFDCASASFPGESGCGAAPTTTSSSTTFDCAKASFPGESGCGSAPTTTSASTTTTTSASTTFDCAKASFPGESGCGAAPTPTNSAAACAQKCVAQLQQCQTAPNANQAYCASQLAACVNYNPYEGGFVTPTACSASSSSTTATPTPTNSAAACAQKCVAQLQQCQTAPNANQAYCASQLAACVNYNPYEGGFVTPTACSASSSSMVTSTTSMGPIPPPPMSSSSMITPVPVNPTGPSTTMTGPSGSTTTVKPFTGAAAQATMLVELFGGVLAGAAFLL